MSEVCRESLHYRCWKKAKAEHEQRREDAPVAADDGSVSGDGPRVDESAVAVAAAAVETTNQADYCPDASLVPVPYGIDEPASVPVAAGSDEPAVIDRMSVVEMGELLAATASSVATAAADSNAGARTVQSELGYGKIYACR